MICSDLNVLELGTASMAASLAGMLFADNGARILKVEPPDGDRLRSENPSGFLVWNRGKESIVADLHTAEGQDLVRRLAADADVVIEAFSPGTTDSWGIGADALCALNPRLVHCSITGFGKEGPYAHLKGYEALVAAKIGMFARGEFAPRPGAIMFTQPSASYGAAMQATAGIAAALMMREQTGVGQRVDATLVQGAEPLDYFTAMIVQAAAKAGTTTTTDPRASGAMAASRYGLLAATKDGYFIQTSTVLPHQGRQLTEAVGLGHLLDLPQNARLPMFDSLDDAQAWEDAVWEAFRTKTRVEWMEILLGYADVPFEFAGTSEEGTYHPQIVHNGDIVTVDDDEVGPIREVGPVANFAKTPSTIVRSARRLDAHDNGFTPRTAAAPATPAPTPAHPLAGITIVDFGYFYAMPYATAMAAALGARVIKLEDGSGDPHRKSFGTEIASVKTMSGKESLSIDLRSAEGRAIAHALLAKADAFVLGFRSGVAEKLGLDYATISKLNPRILYLHAAGYGVDGPFARRALYAQAAQAIGGSFGRQVGYWANPALNVDMSVLELQAVVAPRLGHVVDGDSNAALAVLAALSLGLLHQRRTGEGQFAASSMIGGNAYAYSDDFCTYEGKPPIPLTDDDYFGLHALYRVYETPANWVCLVVPTQKEWEAFVDASGHAELGTDPRFATLEARRAHDAELIAALSAVFAERPASEWETILSAADVGCVAASPIGQGAVTTFDRGMREAGFVIEAPHPLFGTVLRYDALVSLSGAPSRVAPACLRGEHNRSLLRELGYTEEAIDALEASGVIVPPDPLPV